MRVTKFVIARKRGASMLLDTILATSVMISMFSVLLQIMADEHEKTKATVVAAEHEVLLSASRLFLGGRYSDVLTDLYDAAAAVNGPAIKTYSLADLEAQGFVASGFNSGGALERTFDQQHALIARIVDAADATAPQATMTFAQLDPGSTGAIQQPLMNNDNTDGEAEIEAVLVTYGGDAMAPAFGGRVVSRIKLPYSGYVTNTGKTSGAYASFSLDMTPYSAMAEYPTGGRLASPVALSNYGVIGATGADDQVHDSLRRCLDLDMSTLEYADCMASNELYTDIVLRPFDSDGDSTVDTYPALRNVTMIDCGEGGATGSAGIFTIDCPESHITGNLTVDGTDILLGNVDIDSDSISLNGDPFVETVGGETRVNADRVILDVDGGIDLSEGILEARYASPGDLIAKPICPAFAADGITPVIPRIYAQVSGFSDRYGRPVAGVRAWGQDEGAAWRLKMIAYIAQDECTSSPAAPIAKDTPLLNGVPQTAACTGAGPDTLSDVWEVGVDSADPTRNYGIITVFTRCY